MEVIYRKDKLFPSRLNDIKPKVKQLFYLGEWRPEIFEKCVAIVGTRRITSYGEKVIEKIVPALVNAGVTIVSGFMYGIDQKAHQVCIDCGGKTIAVLGWGINCPPKKREEKLYEEILKSGLVISEYPDKTVSQLWMFPYRNRIVAGLSQAVVIAEAAEKSGSLITAKMALDFNRKLLAVPGPITSRVSDGTASLIKSGQAIMVGSGEEILEKLGWGCASVADRQDHPRGILGLLGREPLEADEIAKKLKLPIEKVMVEVSLLELNGEVEEKEGKYWLRQ